VQGYVCEQYRSESYPLPGYQVIAFRDHGNRLTPADTTFSSTDGFYLLDLRPGYYAIRCGAPDREGTWFMVKFQGSEDPIRLDLPVDENSEGLVMVDYTQRYQTWWQSDIEFKAGRPQRESNNDGAVF
jgi:hypothetical protein